MRTSTRPSTALSQSHHSPPLLAPALLCPLCAGGPAPERPQPLRDPRGFVPFDGVLVDRHTTADGAPPHDRAGAQGEGKAAANDVVLGAYAACGQVHGAMSWPPAVTVPCEPLPTATYAHAYKQTHAGGIYVRIVFGSQQPGQGQGAAAGGSASSVPAEAGGQLLDAEFLFPQGEAATGLPRPAAPRPACGALVCAHATRTTITRKQMFGVS